MPAQEVTALLGVSSLTAALPSVFLSKTTLEVRRSELVDEAITDITFPDQIKNTEGQ